MKNHALQGALALAAATAGLTSAVMAEPPATAPRARILSVLVITGGHGFDHSEFFQMFDGVPDIRWTEARRPDIAGWLSAEKAAAFDVLVWYDFGTPQPSEEEARNLLALLDAGKPMLFLHHALASYTQWPEFEKIVGGVFLLQPDGPRPASTFRHDVDLAVQIADRSHPITRWMTDFRLHDEVYNVCPTQPDNHVLLTTDHPESMKALGWTRTSRRSPVVYLQPGHGSETFRTREYRRLVMQSIRWLAGLLPETSTEGFVPLLNGRDFEGWTVMGDPRAFWFKDGVLRSESGLGGHWMRTNRTYRDFILRVEWRVGQGGNSGVFVRSAAEGLPWVTGSEIQITNEYRDTAHCTGSLYGDAPVDPRPDERADMWHEFEIHCVGRHYRVFADGVPVVDVDARRMPVFAGKPVEGYIGLQDSHNRQSYVEYRNMTVKELPMSRGAAVWRLGTQAYTFHKFTLAEAMEKASALGLRLIEMYPGQTLSPDRADVRFDHNAPAELRGQVREMLARHGLTVVNYGVVGLKADEAEARRIFDFAREMGIETVVSEPEDTPACWQLLDRLTQEYGINLAVHNHPKPSHYWDPKVVLERVRGLNPRIGACADTGHWLRSGVEPLEALRLLEGRIITLHFKDLNAAAPDAHDVIWGTGRASARALLEELHRQGFDGVFSIEYEHNWLNSMPEIAGCIAFFDQATAELGRR